MYVTVMPVSTYMALAFVFSFIQINWWWWIWGLAPSPCSASSKHHCCMVSQPRINARTKEQASHDCVWPWTRDRLWSRRPSWPDRHTSTFESRARCSRRPRCACLRQTRRVSWSNCARRRWRSRPASATGTADQSGRPYAARDPSRVSTCIYTKRRLQSVSCVDLLYNTLCNKLHMHGTTNPQVAEQVHNPKDYNISTASWRASK